MGRKPVGQKAMTGAERQAAYMERLRSNSSKPESPPPNVTDESAELAKAKTRIAELEKETAALKQRVSVAEAAAKAKAPPPSETERQLQQQIADLRRRLRQVSRSSRGTVYLKKGDRKKLIQGCHSDDLLSPGKKQRLDEAFQIINELFQSGKLKELDHD